MVWVSVFPILSRLLISTFARLFEAPQIKVLINGSGLFRGSPGKGSDVEIAYQQLRLDIDSVAQRAAVEMEFVRTDHDFARLFHDISAQQRAAQAFAAEMAAAQRLELDLATSDTRWTLHLQKQQGERFTPKSFKLAPFCLPYEPPCIFAPSRFADGFTDAIDVFKRLIGHCQADVQLMDVFRQYFAVGKRVKPIHANLIRMSTPVPAVVVIQQGDLLMHTFAITTFS
jgi:hypothetical protein